MQRTALFSVSNIISNNEKAFDIWLQCLLLGVWLAFSPRLLICFNVSCHPLCVPHLRLLT